MRIVGNVFLLLGCGVVVTGFLLPVNDLIENGQRVGQDCDGPFGVAIFLVGGGLLALIGAGLVIVKSGFKQSKLALGVFALTVAIISLKAPEVIREAVYNRSAEAACD